MPSKMKQIRLPVTPEQEAVILKLAGMYSLTEYLRQLIEADAIRSGLSYPELNNQHGGKRSVIKVD